MDQEERVRRKRELWFIAVSHQPKGACVFLFFVAAESLKEKLHLKQQRVEEKRLGREGFIRSRRGEENEETKEGKKIQVIEKEGERVGGEPL